MGEAQAVAVKSPTRQGEKTKHRLEGRKSESQVQPRFLSVGWSRLPESGCLSSRPPKPMLVGGLGAPFGEESRQKGRPQQRAHLPPLHVSAARPGRQGPLRPAVELIRNSLLDICRMSPGGRRRLGTRDLWLEV